MASRWSAFGSLLVLALGCGGVAQRTSPPTESAVAGSSSGGGAGAGGLGAGAGGLGAGAVSGAGALGGLILQPNGGGPSAPAELAECRAPDGPGCASDDNYIRIHELESNGAEVVVVLNWPGGPNCGSCTVHCEVCEFTCEIRAHAVQGCGDPNVSVAARSGYNGTAYLDTASAEPHYVDSQGKRWQVVSLRALNTSSPPAAGVELVDCDLSLTVSDGTVIRTLAAQAHFCATIVQVLHPC
jgi:hypothetical protein